RRVPIGRWDFARCAGAALPILIDQAKQKIVLGIGKSSVLPKPLGLGDADLCTARRSRPCLHFEGLVDPMLPKQPVWLACMTAQHLALRREYPGDVDPEIRRNWSALAIMPPERIHEVEMRNLSQGRRWLPLPRDVVGTGRAETRVSDQKTGHLMIGDVI